MAPVLPLYGSSDFGTPPIFGQLFDKPRLVCGSQLVLPHLGHNSVSKRLSVSLTVGFDPLRRAGTVAAFAGCPGGAERKTPC